MFSDLTLKEQTFINLFTSLENLLYRLNYKTNQNNFSSPIHPHCG